MNDKLKIMYVDDDEMNLLLFSLNFDEKYQVITSDSGLQALKLLEENIDTTVVISDMKMPVMTGLEFIQKAKVKFPHINFYILTGYDTTKEIQEAIKIKLIRSYFRKPFNFNEINNAIKNVLK